MVCMYLKVTAIASENVGCTPLVGDTDDWIACEDNGWITCTSEDNCCSELVCDTIIECGITDVCEEVGCTPLVGDTDGGTASVVISVI